MGMPATFKNRILISNLIDLIDIIVIKSMPADPFAAGEYMLNASQERSTNAAATDRRRLPRHCDSSVGVEGR